MNSDLVFGEPAPSSQTEHGGGTKEQMASLVAERHETPPQLAKPAGIPMQLVLSFLGLALPMMGIAVALLVIVSRYSVNDHVGKGAYVLDFSATTFVFIASLASTISTSLTVPAMLLVSYPVARRLVAESGKDHPGRLPTPYQLQLWVSMLGGSIFSLYKWVTYKLGWKGRRVETPHGMTATVVLLTFMVIMTLLLTLADAWLHNTTETSFKTVSTTRPVQSLNLGVGISPACVDAFNNRELTTSAGDGTLLADPKYVWYPCNVQRFDISYIPTHSTIPFSTINNRSADFRVTMVEHDKTYAVMSPGPLKPGIDFEASSYAVATECGIVADACVKGQSTASITFNCKDEYPNLPFNGTQSTVNFPDWSAIAFDTATKESLRNFDVPNPFTYAALSNTENIFPNEKPISFQNQVNGIIDLVLYCNVSVFDIDYTVTNGTFDIKKMELSNSTVAQTVSASLVLTKDFGSRFYHTAVQNAAISGSSVDAFTSAFSDESSRTMLALAAGGLTRLPSTKEIDVTSQQTAVVSKAPVYALVALCLVYVVLGITLTISALLSRAGFVDMVQAQLSLTGIAAYAFEPVIQYQDQNLKEIEDLYEERRQGTDARVGLGRGTWRFAIFRPPQIFQ